MRLVVLLGLVGAVLVSAVGSHATPRGSAMLSDCDCYEYLRVRSDGQQLVQVAPSVGDLKEISADGTWILFQHEFGVLYVARLAAFAAPTRVAGTLGAYSSGRFSPDATQVAYLLYSHVGGGSGPASLHLVGADGLNDRLVVPTGVWSVAWSHDGRSLAYVRVSKPASGPSQLVTRDLATGAEQVVAARVGLIQDVAWSPAGDRLAYAVTKDTSYDSPLHVVRTDGTHDLTISRGGKPTWSPDGHRLAYVWSRRNGRTRGLAVIARDGSLNHLVDARAEFMAWSPDSRRLVFPTYKDDATGAFATAYLVVADRDGTHRHRIVTGDTDWALGPLRWNRSGIVFTRWIDFGHD